MDEITLGDLAVLIQVLEKELDSLHQEIESEEEAISDDAAELSTPYWLLSMKLKRMYNQLWEEDSNYPPYEELVERPLP